MMKKKITLQLSSDVLDRLKAAAEERGVNRAIVIEKALVRFLSETADAMAAPIDRFAQLEEQLRTIRNELKAVNETVGLHARYHLALTSLSQERGADQATSGSFELNSAEATGEAVSAKRQNPTRHEAALRADSYGDEIGTEPPFGAPTRRAGTQARAGAVADVCWGLPAAVEGGAEDPFRLSPPRALG